MGNDNVKQFPRMQLGMRAQPGTLDSDADPGNPSTDSIRGLLRERARLIERYGSYDGSVWEVERKLADRVAMLAGPDHDASH